LKGGKNKNMEETPMQHDPNCPHCVKRAEEAKEAEQIGMAFLIALMPLLSITLFSNIGLL